MSWSFMPGRSPTVFKSTSAGNGPIPLKPECLQEGRREEERGRERRERRGMQRRFSDFLPLLLQRLASSSLSSSVPGRFFHSIPPCVFSCHRQRWKAADVRAEVQALRLLCCPQELGRADQ